MRILVLLFFCLLACTNKNPANVVLVFEEARSPSDYISPSGNLRKTNPTMGIISYIKNDTLRFYSPKTNFDTLSLAVPKEGLEIQIKEKIAPFNYLLQQGDTILVTIDEFGNPFLKSKVSQENTTFYNLPYEISTGQKYLGMSPLVGLVSFGHELERIELAKTQMPDLYEMLKESYASRDSLIMSFELYDANFKKELDEIKSKNQFSEEQINYLRYIKRLNESFFTWGKANSSKEKPVKDAFSDFYNDAYLDFVSYTDFLEYAFGFYYELAENIPRVYGGIGTKIDSRETFKKIIKDTEIPPKTKNYVLKFTLTKLLEQFGEEEGYTYVKEYEKLAEESFSREDEKNIKYAQDELFLKDLSGNQVTFQTLLQKYRGKMIYIDFWASWCVPCREQIPMGKKLHEKYRSKDIAFLYFALNDNEQAWKKACKELGVQADSYFVMNPKTAKFIVDNEISSIPRYVLFDKGGKLIDRSAPRPKDNEIDAVFDKYLKE